MTRETWLVAIILTSVLALTVAIYVAYNRGIQLDKLQSELITERARNEQLQEKLANANQTIEDSKLKIEELTRKTDQTLESQQKLEAEMRAALESKDVTISRLKGRLNIEILDRVMFNSGEAVLKPEGIQVLEKIAKVLSENPQRQVLVIGHTDNVPIKPSARDKFPSNWELSTARATAAVRFLCENGKIDPRRIGVVGYGEYRPIADNSTEEGRAKNRRIAIVILDQDIMPVDLSVQPSATSENSDVGTLQKSVKFPVSSNAIPGQQQESNIPAMEPVPLIKTNGNEK
jgi:chemotaxis protein MotB